MTIWGEITEFIQCTDRTLSVLTGSALFSSSGIISNEAISIGIVGYHYGRNSDDEFSDHYFFDSQESLLKFQMKYL